MLSKESINLSTRLQHKAPVVLKIIIRHMPMENCEDTEKEIVEKINQLQDITIPKSEDVWHFLSQLKRGNLEIVGSQLEEGVVIWCWCRSRSALRAFEKLSMSNMHQPNLLTGLFSLLLRRENAPYIVNIDLGNYQDEVVCRELNGILREKDATVNKRQAFGVTMHQGKIFFLCRGPNAVSVYEEGDLTKPSEELSLDNIVAPNDMAYSKESNCLYITDKGTAGVWKIIFTSSEKKVIRWLASAAADPFTLSVTSDGRVVMVKRGPPSSLEIYHPDARLLLRLSLPTLILKPNHAVETSKGTLVVCFGEGSAGGICEITKNGQLISCFGSIFGSINGVAPEVNKYLSVLARGQFVDFNYLAIDDKDQVYACDGENGELRVFDPRLFQLNDGESGLHAVYRVQYFQEKKQLVVLYGSKKTHVTIFSHGVNF